MHAYLSVAVVSPAVAEGALEGGSSALCSPPTAAALCSPPTAAALCSPPLPQPCAHPYCRSPVLTPNCRSPVLTPNCSSPVLTPYCRSPVLTPIAAAAAWQQAGPAPTLAEAEVAEHKLGGVGGWASSACLPAKQNLVHGWRGGELSLPPCVLLRSGGGGCDDGD